MESVFACSKCPSSLPFPPSHPIWMCSCGHLRCDAHRETLCCDGCPSILGNALLDPIVKYTLDYLSFLSEQGGWYRDYISNGLIGLTTIRIQEMYMTFPLCQVCNSTPVPTHEPCLNCANRLQSEGQVSRSLPVPTTGLFLGLDTLSIQPAQRSQPWSCPKCHALVPGDKSVCACKYVDLKRIREDIDQSLPLKPPPVSRNLSNSMCWTCSNCQYEYNFSQKCGKCNQMKPNIDSFPWICPICHYSNSKNSSKCVNCSQKCDESPWICPKCSQNCQFSSCFQCNIQKKDLWKCFFCAVLNQFTVKKCGACGKERHWECGRCTMWNPVSKGACMACELKRQVS